MTIETYTKVFLLIAFLWMSATAIIAMGDIITKALGRVVHIVIRGGKSQRKS